MENINVVLLGPTRVGKTSLLAAMYECMKGEIQDTDLRLYTSPETAGLLAERVRQLTKAGNLKNVQGLGVEANNAMQEFKFRIAQRPIFGTISESESPLQITIRDYPGRWISSDQITVVKQYMENCLAAIVVIDTPALMESRPDFDVHKFRNIPDVIEMYFKNTFAKADTRGIPRLVLFVPVQCEKYTQDPAQHQRLIQRIREGYRGTFEVLQPFSSNVAVAITPVETIGSLRWARFVDEDNPGVASTNPASSLNSFEPISPSATYHPKNAEQPLRYILRFVFNVIARNEERLSSDERIMNVFSRIGRAFEIFLEGDLEGAIGGLSKLIQGNKPFKQAVKKFEEGSKAEPPFQIVQRPEGLI